MERSNFIKSVGLGATGMGLGLINPTSVFSKESNLQSSIIRYNSGYEIELHNKQSGLFLGWLARLVVGAFVSSLVAKVVDKMIPDPVCTGGKCSLKNANYVSQQGIYGYENVTPRFYTQKIYDTTSKFENMSVPFVVYNNNNCGAVYKEVIKIEGPYLAGLCHLSNELVLLYPRSQVREIIIPKSKIYEGGYRFDTADCYGNSYTEFSTDYGKTQLSYNVANKEVEAKVYNKVNRLDFNNKYAMNV